MRIINRVIYLTLAVVVLASLGLLSQVQAVSPTPEPDRPTLAEECHSPNIAGPTYNFNNSKFHGWWRNTMIGSMNGFNAGGPNGALQDQYIYIDTSVYPVKISTTYGTDRFPRLKPDVFDSRPVPLP